MVQLTNYTNLLYIVLLTNGTIANYTNLLYIVLLTNGTICKLHQSSIYSFNY